MKILIIKLGAKGDIVRTLPIALALKKKYHDCEISWLTKKQNSELVKNSPYIDKVLVLPYDSKEKFDVMYSFDIETRATELANKINADKKLGFYNESGFVSAFNLGAEYYLSTLFDDEIKRTNKKTYQEMMFMAAELEYNKEFHPLILKKEQKQYAEKFAEENNLDNKKLIGIHIGSSPRWPSKSWHHEKIKEFILKVREKGYEITIFSGPDDSEKRKEVLDGLDFNVAVNDPDNTDLEFASLVDLCEFIVCGDTFTLHVALALKKKTIALFFCTSPDEIESYGFLKKITSPLLYDFFPEKSDQYSEELVNSIQVEEVLKAIKSWEENG